MYFGCYDSGEHRAVQEATVSSRRNRGFIGRDRRKTSVKGQALFDYGGGIHSDRMGRPLVFAPVPQRKDGGLSFSECRGGRRHAEGVRNVESLAVLFHAGFYRGLGAGWR